MPNKKLIVESMTMQSQTRNENIGKFTSEIVDFDAVIAEQLTQLVGSVSTSAQHPISAKIPSTPPRTEHPIATETDDVNPTETRPNEEQVGVNFDQLLEQQLSNVVPSPVKITKADNPLVCALKVFVLGSTPRIALAVSIQNLPSIETQQGMQGDMFFVTNLIVYNDLQIGHYSRR